MVIEKNSEVIFPFLLTPSGFYDLTIGSIGLIMLYVLLEQRRTIDTHSDLFEGLLEHKEELPPEIMILIEKIQKEKRT